MQLPFCDFEDTGLTFRDKKIYQCSYCGSKLALDDPKANIICFKKHDALLSTLYNGATDDSSRQSLNIHTVSEDHFQHEIQKQTAKIQNSKEISPEQNLSALMEYNRNLCSKEQIDARLKICNSCEHFKDNSCLLCGCVIVREKNFNNKLAHKEHTCPINKWGPIND